MKKRLFVSFAVLAFAVAIGINSNLNLNGKTEESSIALNNVEALAGCEVDAWVGENIWHITIYGACWWSCSPNGVLKCPI